MSFNCLMNSNGRPISTLVANTLMEKAVEMAHHRKTHLKLEGDVCTGILATEWKRGSMGTLYGVEFTAEVVTDSGETKITFLMNDFEIDPDGNWGLGSLETLEQIVAAKERAQKPSRRQSMN